MLAGSDKVRWMSLRGPKRRRCSVRRQKSVLSISFNFISFTQTLSNVDLQSEPTNYAPLLVEQSTIAKTTTASCTNGFLIQSTTVAIGRMKV